MPATLQRPTIGGDSEARHRALLEAAAQARPLLHRYCARLVGSLLDGEDLVQDTLIQAYQRLDRYDPTRPITPWLLGIAHRRCLDFLRRRRTRTAAEALVPAVDDVAAADADMGLLVPVALERLVRHLAPRERACVLLKDVFDHSLEETAAITGSSVGAVKAALHRARQKLAAADRGQPVGRRRRQNDGRLEAMYIERFNRQDWTGVLALTRADATLQVVDAYDGRLVDSPYFARYAASGTPWRFVRGWIEDEPALICLRLRQGSWAPASLVRVIEHEGLVSRIQDYIHCPWMLDAAAHVTYPT